MLEEANEKVFEDYLANRADHNNPRYNMLRNNITYLQLAPTDTDPQAVQGYPPQPPQGGRARCHRPVLPLHLLR